MREFIARWEFQCGSCYDAHPKGTTAMYAPDGSVVATDCGLVADSEAGQRSDSTMPTDKEMAEARNKMCLSCFLVHAGECP